MTKTNRTPKRREEDNADFPSDVIARNTAYVVTTLIKLGGLVLGAHEALFVKPPHDSLVFALAAFMMAGATGLDSAIDRFFGGGGKSSSSK